jgi:hypothetical protein
MDQTESRIDASQPSDPEDCPRPRQKYADFDEAMLSEEARDVAISAILTGLCGEELTGYLVRTHVDYRDIYQAMIAEGFSTDDFVKMRLKVLWWRAGVPLPAALL